MAIEGISGSRRSRPKPQPRRRGDPISKKPGLFHNNMHPRHYRALSAIAVALPFVTVGAISAANFSLLKHAVKEIVQSMPARTDTAVLYTDPLQKADMDAYAKANPVYPEDMNGITAYGKYSGLNPSSPPPGCNPGTPKDLDPQHPEAYADFNVWVCQSPNIRFSPTKLTF